MHTPFIVSGVVKAEHTNVSGVRQCQDRKPQGTSAEALHP